MPIRHRQPIRIIGDKLQSMGVPKIQAAFDLGLHPAHFYNIANGYCRPRPETQRRIADYLDTPIQELFGEG